MGKGEKLQIQGAVYGRWNNDQCSDDIYMKPEFLPPALFGGRCQSGGIFERTKRVCNGKSDCVFNTKGIQNECPETRKQLRVCYSCNEKEACWSQWSNWSECSKECDGGVRSRQRVCVRTGKQSHCAGAKMETQTCNYVPCGCPTDSPCECTFTKNAAGKQLRKFDCSLRGLTTLKGLEIWKEADYFDLSINKIWNGGEVAMLIAQMPNLKRLDLDKNYLTSVPGTMFKNNRQLQFANFLNNRIGAVPEGLFANSPALEVVWFSGNMIKTIPEKLFHANKELLFVEFGRNEIVEVPRFLFKYNTYLDEVHFQQNPLIHVCRDQFRANPNLRIIDLSANNELPPLLARTYCSGFDYCYGYGSGPISVLLALLNVYGDNCYLTI